MGGEPAGSRESSERKSSESFWVFKKWKATIIYDSVCVCRSKISQVTESQKHNWGTKKTS
jgi:hypothetical protein